MTQATRDSLAKLFYPTKERLEAFMQMTKSGVKKKKPQYLVLTVTLEKPSIVQLYTVKRSEKGEWNRKLICNARSLRQVDCYDTPARLAYDLELRQDTKVTRVFAVKFEEKREFMDIFVRVLRVHQPEVFKAIEFLHLPEGLMASANGDIGVNCKDTHADDDIILDHETSSMGIYQTLSAKDEADMRLFLQDSNDAVQNAAEFMAKLREKLTDMEGTNIHSIMSSEDQVLALMSTLDAAIEQVEELETKVSKYDHYLEDVEEAMSKMTDRDKLMHLSQENRRSLLAALQSLNQGLTLDTDQMRALLEVDLKTSGGIFRCTEAAVKLDGLLKNDLPPGLSNLRAVEDKTEEFRRLSDTFAQKLCVHMINIIIRQTNEFSMALAKKNPHVRDVFIELHDVKHKELMSLAKLMYWLKQNKNDSYQEVRKFYCEKMGGLYDREIREFIEAAKNFLSPSKDKKQAALKPSGSNSSLASKVTSDSVSLGPASSLYPSQSGASSMQKFDIKLVGIKMFEEVLCKLKPLVIHEQEFCVEFFHLTDDLGAGGTHTQSESSHDASTLDTSGDSLVTVSTPSGPPQTADDSEVRACMERLFHSVGRELEALIQVAERTNPAHTMNMLVIMHRYFDDTIRNVTFLAKVWFFSIIQIKRAFDKYVEQIIQGFRDFKPNKKARCGLIAPVRVYESVSEGWLGIAQESGRVSEMERAHHSLVQALVIEIDRVANEHGKTPREVVYLENYHRMNDILARLKLHSLDAMKKDIKKKYSLALTEYVSKSMGRPLEKLSTFFEQVQYLLQTGVKEEDVNYQFHTSKQELRKVIKEYPGKEVKKGLEQLCRKVEKHLSEEGNLFEVVWRSMQEEFLKQCDHFERLIQQCYPESGITLEFTTRDIEAYFREIGMNRH